MACCPNCGFKLSAPVTPTETVQYPSGLCIPKATLQTYEAARYGTTAIYTAAPLLAIGQGYVKLSDNFHAGEFMPKDTSYRFLRVAPELIRRLEKIREALGGLPVTVLSSYRPPEYNRKQGGVSNSAHIDGLAADICVGGVSTEALRRVCDIVIGDDGGVGYYPSQQFVHVDVRGYKARWQG